MINWYKSRKSGNRRPYKILVIVCGGQKTECKYFSNYKQRKSGLRIETLNCTENDPENLVNFALKQISKYDLDLNSGDRVWCVFDLDRTKEETLEKIKKLAEDKVMLCLSNPCFELWYILHFGYFENNVSTKDLQNRLEEYINNYNKSEDYFQKLLPKRDEAIKNAKKLNQKHEKAKIKLLSTKSNPSTQVFQLVEYILKVIRQ